eukprot:11268000-Ditylum_brightwellii.AAC.1
MSELSLDVSPLVTNSGDDDSVETVEICDDGDDDDSDSDYDDSNNDDDVIEVVTTKSAETVLRERLRQAKSSGNVYTIADTTTFTAASSSSMRTTFQTISTAVTAMRSSSVGSRSGVPRERQGI